MNREPTETSFNGWKNYETWIVALWLDNDFDLYSDIREAGIKTRAEMSAYIRDMVEEMTPEIGASMFSDLLSAALREVDFDEIAEHYLYDLEG